MAKRKSLPVNLREQILMEAGYRCAVPTNLPDADRWNAPHTVEVEKGGKDEASNLICLCPNRHTRYDREGIPSQAHRAYESTKSDCKSWLEQSTTRPSTL
jgi:hypothetical protein